MIRINRLIRKSTIYEVLQLPNVAKVELVRRKANQKDSNRIRIRIYLTRSNSGMERDEFNGVMGAILGIATISDNTYSTVKTAILDGFIKESTYNNLGVPMDAKYAELCKKYNQEFFDKF